MTSPRRIQRQRTRGWKMPQGTVYVGRPSKWGNPNLVCCHGQDGAVRAFRRDLEGGILRVRVDDVRRELAGQDLACWCPLDQPCHADVLLEIANGPRAAIVALLDAEM